MSSPARVLLVDDYPDTVDVWALYLRHCGYDVLTASEGREAIEIARRTRPDVVVLDVGLPGMSGLDVARALRQFPETATVRMIAATGHSHVSAGRDGEDGMFDAVLVKPCEPVMLAREIDRLTNVDSGR